MDASQEQSTETVEDSTRGENVADEFDAADLSQVMASALKVLSRQTASAAAPPEDGEEPQNAFITRPPSPAPDKVHHNAAWEKSLDKSESGQTYLSNLKFSTLFHATQLRARRKDENRNKGADLVAAMIDYVTKVEDNMERLEKTLDDEHLAKGLTEEPLVEEKNALPGRPKDGARHAKTPIKKLADIKMETRFYHCDGVFGPNGDFAQDGNPSAEPGHYLSNTDPTHLLRVLYDWKDQLDSSDSTTVLGDAPDPAKIDIKAFMISSYPISEFFEERLGLSTDETRVIRIGKPFRSILRNFSQLKEHLSSLEESYGSVSTGFDAARTPQEPQDFVELGEEHEGRSHAATPITADVTPKQYGSVMIDAPDPHLAGQGNLSDETEETAEKLKEAESFEGASALPHFRLLIQFIERYLGPKLALFELLQNGQARTVGYEDLWMLFDTGSTIYCPSHQGGVKVDDVGYDNEDLHTTRRRHVPQAYRVIATLGGAPLQKTLAPRISTAGDDSMSEDTLIRLFTRSSNIQPRLGIQPTSLSIPRTGRMKDSYTALHVICMYVDFDGVNYGTDTEILVFKPFEGEMAVKNLEAFPWQYLGTTHNKPSSGGGDSETPGIRKENHPKGPDYLIERGRKFIDVTSFSQHMIHTGLTVGDNKEEIDSAVIIDLKLAFTEYEKSFPEADSVVPRFLSLTRCWPAVGGAEIPDFSKSCSKLYCHSKDCIEDEFYDNQKRQLAKLESTINQWVLEDFEAFAEKDKEKTHFKAYMEEKDLTKLLPGVVPAFSLRNRAWVQVSLDQLEYVKQQNDWNKLVLPKGHREIVQAMVETHSQGSSSSTGVQENKVEMDLVRGKGKGCIILLHGVPGVGKTSTAECVASYTKRPLYPITCVVIGDIGYEPEAVEVHMGKHFKLAHRWGCVLLLDEADVFLAKRDKQNVKRNGLVSSFLRILEYYSGILFLTTNRVGALDDAFRSRLHLTLYYPHLTERQTLKIWKTNLARLKDINKERVGSDRLPITFDDKKIIKWVKKHWVTIQWNGRQIRNAFQTAMALAEFKAKQSKATNSGGAEDAPLLDTEHFKLLATASAQFSEYLRVTHGDDEEEVAHLDQTRAVQGFQPTAKMKDFSDDEESENSSASEQSESEVDDDDDSESGDNDESESEDSEPERKSKSKKPKKRGKKGKEKSTSSKDEKKDRKEGKGRKK
ncbi:hypothetical protein N0V93_008155 [Gnomoniopsis smithogilvyi]|uniref:AAA+ ATPase domain-containing protein n=1 Tax=Gnomoniopsis smithogilvyi TaxID=1191159 RepID=A0A9W8YL68_9PEZI|nr:hypothetical protein N0V93_008155 [Gnomoniopsis smithogilvyi]